MIFIDTNIFVYAHDETDPKKSHRARAILTELANKHEGCISTQVIQEFCNVVLRKSIVPLKSRDLRVILQTLIIPFLTHQPDADFYFRVLATFDRYSVSFYDALIVQAAIDLNCSVMYSEDLQDGAQYGNVAIINPFIKI